MKLQKKQIKFSSRKSRGRYEKELIVYENYCVQKIGKNIRSETDLMALFNDIAR